MYAVVVLINKQQFIEGHSRGHCDPRFDSTMPANDDERYLRAACILKHGSLVRNEGEKSEHPFFFCRFGDHLNSVFSANVMSIILLTYNTSEGYMQYIIHIRGDERTHD